MKSFFERLRTRRLSSAYVLLGVLSAAIVAGSYAAHGVSGQEEQNASADAAPLKVVNTPIPPNDFVKIAKEVGPAVVNINTQTLPKQSMNNPQPLPRPPHAARRIPTADDGQDDQDGRARAATAASRTSSIASSAGQVPDQGDERQHQVRRSRSAPASSSIPRATSSPTTTSSTKPTRSTSSSPPIPTPRTWAVPPASSASTRPPTWPSSKSTPTSRCPPSRWATPT